MKHLQIVALAAMTALGGCAAPPSLVGGAGAAVSATVLPANVLAQLRATCTAARPLLSAAAAAPNKTLADTASYPAAYCAELNSGTVPATTDANTPSWLPKALAITQAVAAVAGIVLPALGAL